MSTLKASADECENIARAAAEASAQIPEALRRFLKATRENVKHSLDLARVANQTRPPPPLPKIEKKL